MMPARTSYRRERSSVYLHLRKSRTLVAWPGSSEAHVKTLTSNVDVATANGAWELPAVARTMIGVLAAGVIYYLATRAAWLLTFPDSKVSLFFPPHAILI